MHGSKADKSYPFLVEGNVAENSKARAEGLPQLKKSESITSSESMTANKSVSQAVPSRA